MKSMIKRSLTSRSSSSTKPPRISKLIARADIRELSLFLSSDAGKAEACKHGATLDADRQTLLHRVCRLHPTVDIVRELVLGAPGAVLEYDVNRRTPLHVAAAHGASPHVIHFLIRMNPTAAGQQDRGGRTPLHLYCEHSSQPETCDTGDQDEALVKGPLLEVVKLLCVAGPQAVNIEDADDMTPLEYCITSDADVRVIKVLQKASTKAWKMLRDMKAKQNEVQRSFARRPPSLLVSSVSSNDSSTKSIMSAMQATVGDKAPNGGSRGACGAMPSVPRPVSRRKGSVFETQSLAASLARFNENGAGGDGDDDAASSSSSKSSEKMWPREPLAVGDDGPGPKKRISPARAA